MDGLLVDSEIIWHEIEDEFFADRNITYGVEDRQLVVGMRLDEFLLTLKEHFGLDESLESLVDDMTVRMVAALPPRVQPRPGATRLLAYLRENNVPIAVASNSPHSIIDVTMTAVGWDDILTVRRSGDDETRGKPAPDVYLSAAKMLDLDPTKCLGLEDSPRGARAVVAAGMVCGAVPDLSHATPEIFRDITPLVFESLDTVCDWLQEEVE